MLKNPLTMHHAALACSIALHTGLLAWIAWPHAAVETPQQQMVDISIVMLSSLASEESEMTTALTERTLPPTPDAINAHSKPTLQAKHVLHKPKPALQQTVATPPTTGPQAQHATEKIAAITEPVFNAAYLHNIPPPYPDDARREGMEGKVLLDVKVTLAGAAQEVSVRRSSGYTILDYAARNAVKNWRFIPAMRGNEMMEGQVIVPIEFRLEDSESREI